MWIVRSVLLFVIIVAILVFAIGNLEYRTSVRLFTHTLVNVPVNLALLYAGLFGAAVVFLAMLMREFGLRRVIHKLRRENIRLDEELTALRNLPLANIENASRRTDS